MNRSTELEEQINILLSGLEQIIWLLCYFYCHFKILMTCFFFLTYRGTRWHGVTHIVLVFPC